MKFKIHFQLLLFLTVSCILSYLVDRANTWQVFCCFAVLFFVYFSIIRKTVSLKLIIGAAILIRASLLFSIPNLSDDIFRFVWDGQLFAHLINPYLYLPEQYTGDLVNSKLGTFLIAKMNSPSYYSVYPPLSQFIFGTAALVGQNSFLNNVITLKLIYLLCDVCTLLLMVRLLSHFNLPTSNIGIYAFNPLVIIEIFGNAHLEGLMLLLLLLNIYFFSVNRIVMAGVSIAGSISVKMLPLILLPAHMRLFNFRRYSIYLIIILLTSLALFTSFSNLQIPVNILSSIDLYFHKFEFNASIYYLIREIGIVLYGYNAIAVIGPSLAVLTFLTVLLYANKNKITTPQDLFKVSYFSFIIYFAFATTIHPWYLITLVGLSVFVRYKTALLWSMMIVLSYATYSTIPYSENLWLVLIEYSVVAIYLIYELHRYWNSATNEVSQ